MNRDSIERYSLESSSIERTPQLDKQTLAEVVTIIEAAFKGKPCAVYLFGSRARGDAHRASDIDLVVESEENLRRQVIEALELFEESNIIYKVDVVELRGSSKEFQQEVRRDGILLWSH